MGCVNVQELNDHYEWWCIAYARIFGTQETNIIRTPWVALSIWFASVVPTECWLCGCVRAHVLHKAMLLVYMAVVITISIRFDSSTFRSVWDSLQRQNNKRPTRSFNANIRKYSPNPRWSCIEITNVSCDSPTINGSTQWRFYLRTSSNAGHFFDCVANNIEC